MRKVGFQVLSIGGMCLLLLTTAWGQTRVGQQEGGRFEPLGQYSRMFTLRAWKPSRGKSPPWTSLPQATACHPGSGWV